MTGRECIHVCEMLSALIYHNLAEKLYTSHNTGTTRAYKLTVKFAGLKTRLECTDMSSSCLAASFQDGKFGFTSEASCCLLILNKLSNFDYTHTHSDNPNTIILLCFIFFVGSKKKSQGKDFHSFTLIPLGKSSKY